MTRQGRTGVLVAALLMLLCATPLFADDFILSVLTLVSFIIVIVGGLASLPGALVGGLLVGLAEALAATVVAPSMKSLFSYGLLVLVILLRPQGLFGKTGT